MDSTHHSKKPSLLNLVILVVMAMTTMATSPDGSASGQSEASFDVYGESQTARITIAAQSDRVSSFGYDGPFSLRLRSEHFPQSQSEAMRWRVTMEQGGEMPWSTEGGFMVGGDVHTDDDGIVVGELTAHIAPICNENNPTEETDCLPCNLETGCTFNLEIELCDGPFSEEPIPFWFGVVRENGEAFYNECLPDSDHTPCEQLDEWVVIEPTDDRPLLCDAVDMDSDATDMP